jgi:hypothetical protein
LQPKDFRDEKDKFAMDPNDIP